MMKLMNHVVFVVEQADMDIDNENFNSISNYDELENLDFEFNRIKREWYLNFNEWIFELIKKNL